MNKFQKLRIEAGITQVALAKRLGIAKHSIYLYESGRGKPSYPILLRYARVFDVPLDYLMDYVPKPTIPRAARAA